MLADTAVLARECAARKVGLAAFNVVLLDHAEAFVQAAENTGLPLVLQLSQNAAKYHGGRLRPLGRALLELAEASSAQVSVHLDHAEDTNLCREAIELGFTSIMYDGSKLPDAQNRETTAEITAFAHEHGVSVDPSARTDPHDAAQFVADTGVDLLAVAVGSSHAMATREAVLDNDLISAIHQAVPVPLVLHGSSGVPDEGMVQAIRSGMTKINVSTHLNVVFTAGVREILNENPSLVDPRKYVGPATRLVQEEVERLMRLYAQV